MTVLLEYFNFHAGIMIRAFTCMMISVSLCPAYLQASLVALQGTSRKVFLRIFLTALLKYIDCFVRVF